MLEHRMSINIQIVDWYSEDVEIVESDDSDTSDNSANNNFRPYDYQITIFGRDEEKRSIAVTLHDFKPFFYVRVPENWTRQKVRGFIDAIKVKMGRIVETGLATEPKIVNRKIFQGFTNGHLFRFIYFSFNNRLCMNRCKKQFQQYIQGETESDWKIIARELSLPVQRRPTIYSMYESNIDPILRCIHKQELFPSGWASVTHFENVYDSPLTCDIHIETSYTNIHPIERQEIGKIRICAFDIECSSSHCDFPQAIKNYQKLARDIHSVLQRSEFFDFEDEAKEEILSFIFAYAFSVNEDIIDHEFCQEIKLCLSDIGLVYTKKNIKPNDNSIKKVITSLVKCLDVPKQSSGVREKADFNNSLIAKITKILDTYFPDVEGDQVVQIASTIIDYGEETCIKKHIITLGKCSKIDDQTIEVVECKREEKVLLEWRKLIIRFDPDIITGYNINNFDTPFLYDRATELGIKSTFSKLSRFRDRECVIKEKRLASAALGDNIWRELQITGRIQIDIMRVVQRDYNLMSWSLDYVSSYFMNGKIKNLEDNGNSTYTITTNNTKGLQKTSYVNIMINNGITTDLYGDHQKFKVLEYSQTSLIISGKLNVNDIPFKEHACTWCHAKDDIEYNDIFKAWSKNLKLTSDVFDMRAKCAKYCVRDAYLCLDLMKKLDIIANNIGMANVCSVPLSWIFARGQGIKTLSLVSKQCQKEGFVLPVLFQGDDPEYEGAVVLQPKPGIYLDEAIATLDYASLYPSCIISENMSHDSIVLDDKWKGEEGKKRLKELGYDCVDIEWDVYQTKANKKVKVRKETSRFVQFPNNKKSVIPRILDYLLTARRNTRRKIKFKTLHLHDGTKVSGIVKEHDSEYRVSDENKTEHRIEKDMVSSIETTFTPFQQGVMDGLQKAYKITANSIYGQMGAKTSPVKMIAIAACTTATGRKLLMTAKNFIRDKYQNTTVSLPSRDVFIKESETVYGDSVTGDTPIIIKHSDGMVDVVTIETLSREEYIPYTGFKVGQSNRREKQQAYVDVQVWADGVWADVKRVIRHKTKKKIFRVLTHTGCVDVTEDHSLCDENGDKLKPGDANIGQKLQHAFPKEFVELDHSVSKEEAFAMGVKFWEDTDDHKKVPMVILNSPKEIRKEFIRGYRIGDGAKTGPQRCCDCKGKIGTQGLFYLFTSIGENVSVNTRETKPDMFRLNSTYGAFRKSPTAIKKIIDLGYNDENEFVYDIETSQGKFAGGIGALVEFNTDSVFVNFNMYDKKGGKQLKNTELLAATIEMGVEAGKQITKTLKAPHDLEYEKTFHPFILLSKKRYVGNKYEFDLHKYKQTSMGIVLKRRDNAKIVKYVYGGAIDIIMKEQNLQKAIDFVKHSVYKLINGKFNMDYLIITKSLRSFYKNPQQIAHKVLADRMGDRDPGNKPKSNDRIPYVYIVKKCKKKEKLLQGDKIEHPDFILKHNLAIDYRHYVTNQISKPVCQVFALELEKIPKYKPTPKLKKRIREYCEASEDTKLKKYDFLRKEREKITHELLFSEAVHTITNTMNKQGDIRNFFQRVIIPK